jgi:hypothetical protein
MKHNDHFLLFSATFLLLFLIFHLLRELSGRHDVSSLHADALTNFIRTWSRGIFPS